MQVCLFTFCSIVQYIKMQYLQAGILRPTNADYYISMHNSFTKKKECSVISQNNGNIQMIGYKGIISEFSRRAFCKKPRDIKQTFQVYMFQ